MISDTDIKFSPNGNGGFYQSMTECGVNTKLKELGIEYMQVLGIDNILAKLGDPKEFALMDIKGFDVSAKFIEKAYP